VPVPLLWPEAATHTEVTARVWGAGGRRADGYVGRWREVPPEPAAERDSLPWLTLTAAGPEPLAVLLAADGPAGPPAVVERSLIQAVLADDGTTAVRARFVLLRWAGGVDVDLPPGVAADVFVDGKRIDPLPRPDGVRVPVPDPKPGRTACVLDVRVQGAAAGGWRGRTILPPRVRAAFRSPARWSVTHAAGTVPLVPAAAVQADARWGWRGYGFGPAAADSPADLDRWLRDGVEADAVEPPPAVPPGGEVVAVRQPALGPLTLIAVPRTAWVAGASFLAFATAVGLARLRAAALGPAVLLLAVTATAAAVVLPHPTAQFVAAAQPGLLSAAVLVAGTAAADWYQRRKADRLPAFSRGPSGAAPTPLPPASAGRPSGVPQPVPIEPSASAGS
jgi:hypothetical protein